MHEHEKKKWLNRPMRIALGVLVVAAVVVWVLMRIGVFRRLPPCVTTFEFAREEYSRACFSSDGRHILASQDTELALWDVSSGERVREFTGQGQRIVSVALSPDDQYALSGHQGGGVCLWDVSTGERVSTFTFPKMSLDVWNRDVWDVDFSPDGTRFLATGGEHTIEVWDVATGNHITSLPTGVEYWDLFACFAPDSEHVVGGWEGGMAMWEVTTGQPIPIFPPERKYVRAMATTPDRRYVAISTGLNIEVWDMITKECVLVMAGLVRDRLQTVYSVSISPDGEYLLTEHQWAVRLWRVSTGEHLYTFKWGHSDPAFSPDGKHAMTGTNKGIKLWDLSEWLDESSR